MRKKFKSGFDENVDALSSNHMAGIDHDASVARQAELRIHVMRVLRVKNANVYTEGHNVYKMAGDATSVNSEICHGLRLKDCGVKSRPRKGHFQSFEEIFPLWLGSRDHRT